MEGKARVFSATGLGCGVTVDGFDTGTLTLNAELEAVTMAAAAGAAPDEGPGTDGFFLGVVCFLGEEVFFEDLGAPDCLL